MTENLKKKYTIVLATGGTGGHIFPAVALAEQLKDECDIHVITDERFARHQRDAIPAKIHTISSGTLGGSALKKAASLFKLGRGYVKSRSLLNKIKPDVVVGFGGYPSFPTMLAAVHKKYPTVIHEQNSILGKANYVLAPKVNKIATSFESVSGISSRDAEKVTFTGNPVRPSVKALHALDYPELDDTNSLHILVTGGSQGANIFSEVIPEAIRLLPEDLRVRIRVDQQCRDEDLAKTKEVYKALRVQADLAPFFTDMPVRLAAAHLVIARAGASTLAELAVAKRPAILVPYPHATDNHQQRNAEAFEDAHAAWVMTQEAFTSEALAMRLESFLSLPKTLKDYSEACEKLAILDADQRLAKLILDPIR